MVAPWFPIGVDYTFVSINSLYSARLKNVAALSIAVDSEFLFMSSVQSGYVGNFLRENLFTVNAHIGFNLGFFLLLGYSHKIESLIEKMQQNKENEAIKAGITWCAVRRHRMLLGNLKSIALVSEDILFDEEAFLTHFEKALSENINKGSGVTNISYYAEKFGYRRFYIPYETDNPTDMNVSRLLIEMEFPETKQITGPSPEIDFPFFVGTELVLSHP
jgi:hypothetical protein